MRGLIKENKEKYRVKYDKEERRERKEVYKEIKENKRRGRKIIKKKGIKDIKIKIKN